MPTSTKYKRSEQSRELRRYADQELKSLAGYAVREYAKIGCDIVNELGSFFTGVRMTAPKKRK